MELRHFRYFLAVAEEGSFSRAAERLIVSQPTLSRQVAQLERKTGRRLFDRQAGGVALTAAGEALVGHARQLIRLEASTRDIVSSARQVEQTVIIGVSPTMSGQWFIDVIEELRLRLPDLTFSIFEAYSVEQLRAVREGNLDIALVTERPPASLHSQTVSERPFGLAVTPEHPLSQQEQYRVGDLSGLRILARTHEQVPAAHDLAISEIESLGAVPLWEYMRFTEHARACALATHADALFCGAHTAGRHVPDWPWRPIQGLRTTMALSVAWSGSSRPLVSRVAALMLQQEAIRRPG